MGAEDWGFDDSTAYIDSLCRRVMLGENWHVQYKEGEPPAGKGKWRTKDRSLVVDIRQMPTEYLKNCINFARNRRQHQSKLPELLAELARREGEPEEIPL